MSMTTTLVPSPATALGPALDMDAARRYVQAGRCEHTERAYSGDWSRFATWAAAEGLEALPAAGATAALYAAHLARSGRKPSTIERALAGIGAVHRRAGHDSPSSHPAVRAVLRGIRRQHGTAQRQARPLMPEHLSTAIGALDLTTLRGMRDRAILTLGFSAALRRSEIVALDVEDVRAVPEGLVITIRRSKTDPEGRGRAVGVPYAVDPALCPVLAVLAWRAAAGLEQGALFVDVRGGTLRGRLSDRAVAMIVKRGARAAGLDPAMFSGHSLRSGLATAAARAGRPEHSIAQQTGHRSERVLRRYIRLGSLFCGNAATGLL